MDNRVMKYELDYAEIRCSLEPLCALCSFVAAAVIVLLVEEWCRFVLVVC